jgi:hypothetical protein
MSTVVVFPSDRARTVSRAEYGPAQIFIFTGVRYERLEYVAPKPAPRRRRSPRRMAQAEVPFTA